MNLDTFPQGKTGGMIRRQSRPGRRGRADHRRSLPLITTHVSDIQRWKGIGDRRDRLELKRTRTTQRQTKRQMVITAFQGSSKLYYTTYYTTAKSGKAKGLTETG